MIRIDFRNLDGISNEPGVVYIDKNEIVSARCFQRISKFRLFFNDEKQWNVVLYMKNGFRHQIDVDNEESGLNFIENVLKLSVDQRF